MFVFVEVRRISGHECAEIQNKQRQLAEGERTSAKAGGDAGCARLNRGPRWCQMRGQKAKPTQDALARPTPHARLQSRCFFTEFLPDVTRRNPSGRCAI